MRFVLHRSDCAKNIVLVCDFYRKSLSIGKRYLSDVSAWFRTFRLFARESGYLYVIDLSAIAASF
jgi:hypothetical protein